MGFDTRREAQIEQAKVVRAVADGQHRGPSKLTVAEWLERWLERRERESLRPSTARMYRSYIEHDVVPAIGLLKLAELRKAQIDRFLSSLTEAGRGATTVRRIHAVLSSALSAAERVDLISRNPAARLSLPSPPQRRTQVWEPEEVRQFLDTAAAHRIGALYELAVYSGLRRGELAGLRWTDVDMPKRELRVRRQRVQVGGRVLEGDVKTQAGQDRRVSLGDQAISALTGWRLRQLEERRAWAEAYEPGDFVFTRENGEPLRPGYISKVFETLVMKADVPRMTVHGLRHQHASLLLAGGVNIAIVSKRLGHSTIAITSDLYSHLLGDANRDAAMASEAVLFPGDRTDRGTGVDRLDRSGDALEAPVGPASIRN